MKLQDLLNYHKIAVQCHDAPDADALACLYAVYWYLKENGRTARLIYGSPLGEETLIQKSSLKHMLKDLGLEGIVQHITHLEDEPDLLLYVDCHPGEPNVRLFGQNAYPLKKVEDQESQTYQLPVNFETGENVRETFGAGAVAVIDHHKITHPKNLPPMQTIQPCKSCSTILWTMLLDEGIDLRKGQDKGRDNRKKQLATALYYGLYTDSSELQELNGGRDQDLVDALNANFQDESILFRWKTSNLSLQDMKNVVRALSQYDYYEKDRFAITGLKSEDGCYPDQNLLGIIGDLLICVDKIDTCVTFCEQATKFRLSVRTCTQEAMATDVIRFITKGLGGGGGHPRKTGGELDKEPLRQAYRSWYNTEEEDLSAAVHQFLADRMRTYYSSFDVFYSGEAETAQKINIHSMKLYEKKADINIGYIHLAGTGLYKPGTVLTIRTLQGDMVETVKRDTYLLFGVDGELYTNSKEAFLSQYEESSEHYTFPAEYRPHIPSAIRADEAQQKKLDADALLAHIRTCRPKPGHQVYARRLERRAKVFSKRRPDGYLLGEPGDWLVANAHDISRIHIVKADSFPKLYFMVKSGD